MDHDFEFQLGRYRALRGRGWRGLLALTLLLFSIVIGLWSGSPIISAAARLLGK